MTVEHAALLLSASSLTIVASLAGQSTAGRTVQPERPTVATHAGTVAPGYLEIEAGGEFDRAADHSRSASFPLLFKIGLGKRLQLSLLTPVTAPSGNGVGPGDMGAGLKWRLLEGAPLLGDFAVFPSIKFPTGAEARGRGTGTTDASLLLISSHTLGPVAIDLNAGITRRSGDGTGTPRTAAVWTASFGGLLAGPVGWVGELFGYPETRGLAGNAAIVALLAGPTLRVDPSLVLDVGGIVPLTGPQPYALYVGLTWNLGRL